MQIVEAQKCHFPLFASLFIYCDNFCHNKRTSKARREGADALIAAPLPPSLRA